MARAIDANELMVEIQVCSWHPAARRKEKIMKKRILDVACGSKMFWFDKHNPDVEFCDKKVVPYHEYYKNMKPSEGDA